MAFKLQGKDMNDSDMMYFLESIREWEVLDKLEEREISFFLERLLIWQRNEIIKKAEMKKCKVDFLADLLVSGKSIRETGKALIKKSNEGKVSTKEQMINFISKDFIQVLQPR